MLLVLLTGCEDEAAAAAPATTTAAVTEAVESSSSTKEEKKTTKAPETTTTAPATTAPETEPENVAGDSYWEEPVAEAPPQEPETDPVQEAPQPPQAEDNLYEVVAGIISNYGYYYHRPAEYGSVCWTNGQGNFIEFDNFGNGIYISVSINYETAVSKYCLTRAEVENFLYSFPL